MPSAEAIAIMEGLCPAARAMLVGSSVPEDIRRLQDLSDMSAIDQEYSLRRHVGLGIPWPDALPTKDEAVSDLVEGDTADGASAPAVIGRWRVDAIRPNQHNEALFPDSLSAASISIMAEDLREHGQEQPIQITPEGVIINGERRWRAALQLRWPEVDVVLTPLRDEEILDRVLSICGSSRQMSLREQVNVYAAVLDRLKIDHGRRQGRPEGKTIPSGDVFQSPKAIKQTAAARAKFDSPTEAERALAVFTRGNLDLQSKVSAGEMTLTAAYNELPKRHKAKKVSAGNEAPDSSTGIGRPPTGVAPVPAAERDEEVAELKVGRSEGTDDVDRSPGSGSTGTVAATALLATVDGKELPGDDGGMSIDGAIRCTPPGPNRTKGLPGRAKGLASSPTVTGGTHAQQPPATGPDGADGSRPLRKAPSSTRELLLPEPNESNVSDDPFGVRLAAAQPPQSPVAETDAFDRALDTIDDCVASLCRGHRDRAVHARDLVVARLDATIAKWAPVTDTPIGQSDGCFKDNQEPQDDASEEPETAADSSDDDAVFESDDDLDSEQGDDPEDDDTETGDDSDGDWPVEDDVDSDGEDPKDDLDAEVDRIIGTKRRR